MTAPSEMLDLAIRHHQAGQLREAETLYQQILQADPQNVHAWHLLGVVAAQVGKHERAVELISHALRLQPGFADAHLNLGNALLEQDKVDEAIVHFRQTLAIRPDHADAYIKMGNALCRQGKFEEALAHFQTAIHYNPGDANGYFNLANALERSGKLQEAAGQYRNALKLRPDFVQALNNLGNIYHKQDKYQEAAGCFQNALSIKPDYVQAHINLGGLYQTQGNLERAEASFQQALRLKGDNPEALNNLGIVRVAQGQADDAVAHFRAALRLNPAFAEAHGNLLFTLLLCPQYDAQSLLDEHRLWNRQYAEPLKKFMRPHANDKSPDRRLRVGYVSSGFSLDPIGRFMLPLLEAHDHTQFEIFCYADLNGADVYTDQCRRHADLWRPVFGLSDERLAELIRSDRIDILVDLAMHTMNNRLLTFARKPAPVQVTYLAYCGTTGLDAMDYRLTDPYLDPPGENERNYSEQSIHLPETFWCYKPVIAPPPLTPPPALQNGFVTFGCLTNFCKVMEPTMDAWTTLLKAVPGSRLLLYAPAGAARMRAQNYFAQREILPERLIFTDRVPLPEYFLTYERIDIALDTFPFAGGTTTCDALWMGVPVVTLAGRTSVGRGGVSILTNLGLPELVASSVDGYVDIAAQLARDARRLKRLHATLRDRMQNSPLMNASAFARHVEAAYRTMWGAVLRKDPDSSSLAVP